MTFAGILWTWVAVEHYWIYVGKLQGTTYYYIEVGLIFKKIVANREAQPTLLKTPV